jgi:hypothetical protein
MVWACKLDSPDSPKYGNEYSCSIKCEIPTGKPVRPHKLSHDASIINELRNID